MTFLKEHPEWEEDLLQIEDGFHFTGGEGGIANIHARTLGSRTKYLKNHMEEIESAINQLTPESIGASEIMHVHSKATALNGGFMSAEDKKKIDQYLELSAMDAGKVLVVTPEGKVEAKLAASGLPIGVVFWFAGKNVPIGAMECNGQSLSRTAYSELFAAIGTTYGSLSDLTFKLPPREHEGKGLFVRAATTEKPVATVEEDYIRDIQGTVGTRTVPGVADGVAMQGTGAFELDKTKTGGIGAPVYKGPEYTTVDFKASRVVPTGDENKPVSISYLKCIQVANGYHEPVVTSIDQIAQGIANKAERDEVTALAGTRLWISGEYQPVLNIPTIVMHGLNIDPLRCRCDVLLKCVIAEQGYAIGDYAQSWAIFNAIQTTSPLPLLLTNTIQLNTGGNGTGIFGTVKTTGAGVQLTLKNWRYVFRIWY